MNDFTKDELKILLLELTITIRKITVQKVAPSIIDLRNKIEAMITNYCDHKSQQMDCDGGMSLVCSDCGKTTVDV